MRGRYFKATIIKGKRKGGAFKAGIIYAYNKGFTHALQMDADGQHDYKRVEFFINKSKEQTSLSKYFVNNKGLNSYERNYFRFQNI